MCGMRGGQIGVDRSFLWLVFFADVEYDPRAKGWIMKTFTVQIPDEIYDKVERRAAARGASINEEIVDVLKRFQTRQEQVERQVSKEIAAVSGPSRDTLLSLAERCKPPQSWYEEEDELF